MSQQHQPAATENPFCSSRVRPGALPFLFAANENTAQLVDRLRQNGWWGQVVGGHGSGKSALLAALVPAVKRAGRRTLLIELHDGQHRLPIDLRHAEGLDSSTVLIIDGYEQLGLWARFRVKRFCRRVGLGLLVTAHLPVGLPDLFETAVNLELAQQIVEQLQRQHPSHVTPEDVVEQFSRHAGNLRETLFDLYDLYERRRRGQESFSQ